MDWDFTSAAIQPRVATLESEHDLAHFCSQNQSAFLTQKTGAESIPPPVSVSVVPSGITHYTLQARLCAKGRVCPPFGIPEEIVLFALFQPTKSYRFCVANSYFRTMQKAAVCPHFRLDIRRSFAETGDATMARAQEIKQSKNSRIMI